MADKNVKELRTVPFISYRRADTGDSYAEREQREYETRIRHWTMVWWKDHEDKLCTAEFMVVTEHMPDFCGGLLVYSPRIDTYYSRCTWTAHFCSPGSMPDEDMPSTRWSDFKQNMAIDLARFTGKDTWKDEEVRDYGMKCILAQLCGAAMNHGKKGLVGADYIGGHMTRLWRLARKLGEIPCNFLQCDLHIKNKMSSGLMRCLDGRARLASFNGRFDDEWYNSNSGNQVHWLTADLSPPGGTGSTEVSCYECNTNYDGAREEECPECGTYNEWDPMDDYPMVEQELPKYVKDVVENPEFQRRARRYYWRNG